jgi:DNA-binding PucR family transcriptional regulator
MLGIPDARLGPADSDEHLVEILLGADEEALSDLRDRALGPLAGLRAGSADKLTETLRSWLLHRGRREKVAAELFVHPQTVRYRMGQLRELYGDLLDDPATVLELTVALALDGLRLPSTVVTAGPARLAEEADHHEDRGGSR